MSVNEPPRSGSVQLVIVVFRVVLGVLFLTVWGSNLHKGLYGADHYENLIRFYVSSGDAPSFWKSVMRAVADAAPVLSKAQLVTELAFGVALVLGVLTRVVGVSAGLFLTSLWISEIGVPGEWIWSLVFPSLVAFALALVSAGRVLGLDALLLRRPPLDRLPRWLTG